LLVAEVGAIGPHAFMSSLNAFSHLNLSERYLFFMSIKINIDKADNIDKVLRRFKKMCEKEGLIKEIKKKQYYEKPCQKKRREYLKRKRRHQKLLNLMKQGIQKKKKRF